MKINANDVVWILDRIKWLETMPNRPATHKNIWAGSYDVWSCPQDRIDAIEMPKARMKNAEDAGFIKSQIVKKDHYELVVWTLTELGREYLERATEVK